MFADTKTASEPEPDSKSKFDECFEVLPSEEQEKRDYFSPDLVTSLNCISFQKNHQVYHVPIEDIIDKLIDQSDDISCAEQNHSDLIAGIYEGFSNF